MAEGKRAQSVGSEDLDGSDLDLPPGNKRSKESNRDSDQRKVQNRIAQREFRQRKQQYIKDLEARLELLESAPNEQLEQLRSGMKALLDENHELRTLLASLAGFVGEGLGSVLPKLQIELPEFKALLSRGRTDLVHQALEAHNATHQHTPTSTSAAPPRPRPSLNLNLSTVTAAASASRPSPVHYSPTTSAAPAPSSSRPALAPLHSSTSSLPPAVQPTHPPNSTPVPPQPATPRFPTGHSGTGGSPYQTGQSPASAGFGLSPAGGGAVHRSPTSQDKEAIARSDDWIKQGAAGGMQVDMDTVGDNVSKMFSMPTDNPKLQAVQLISYHMRNKRDNPNYKLPPSLRATITQSSVPHSPFFDGIIFASLRDRLILLKDQYDLATLLGDLIDSFVIHGQDCLVPSNWELSETFLRKYWYVIDPEVLEVANRWRRERGDPELAMRDIVP